jgi:probable phosphoglycerate mutase
MEASADDETRRELLSPPDPSPVTDEGDSTEIDPARHSGPKIFLIRHAHEDGPKDPYRGRPLSVLGRRQAEALARRMADWQLDALICSDTYRAFETASAVHAFHPGVPMVVDPTFREVSTSMLAACERGDPAQSGLHDRLEAAWSKIVTIPYGAAALFIHNGMIRYLLGRALKYERSPRPPIHCTLTGISALQVKSKGRADVRFVNDTRHLTPALVPDDKTWVEDVETGRWCFGPGQ